MISENTMEATYPLAELLAKKGIALSPMPSTPLDSLVTAGHLPRPTKGVAEGFLPAPEAVIAGSRSKDAFGVCHHDMAMDEIVEVVAASVSRNMDLARNVVNPMVKEAVMDAETYMEAGENIKQTRISVIPEFASPLWNSPTLSEMVSKYNETPINEVKLYLGVPHDLDQVSLLELAKTGASRFDEEVEALFESMGAEEVSNVYQYAFGEAATMRSPTLNPLVRSNAGPTNHTLLVHLFARKLLQDPPEGVQAGLQEYRAYMADILSQTGRAVAAMIRRREVDRERRVLVRSYPYNRDRIGEVQIDIRVNGDVYTQWLKEGGEPEVLMGAFASDQDRSYTGLLEKKERYLKEWERQERVLATTQRFNRFNTAVEAVKSAVSKQINLMDGDSLAVERGLLHRRLTEQCKDLRGRFYEDLYGTLRTLICNTIFPHTDARRILEAIDNVCHENPEIEVREAALLATIEIVATWVAKLCRVETHAV